VKVLKQSDAALRKVTSVKFKATATPSGIATNFIGAAEGKGVMTGWDGQAPKQFFAHVMASQPGSEEKMELSGGSNGDLFFLLDHAHKKAYEDMDSGVMGSGRNALGAINMPEFLHPNPFDDEIGAEAVELAGVETIAGVECHKVEVTYAGGQGKSTWFISTEDMLPRRRVRYFNIPQQGEGTLETTITELVVNPEIEASVFDLDLPEGFEKVDDFAP